MGIQRTYKPTELHILISVNKARMSGLLVPSYRTGFGFDTIAHDRRAFELSQKAFRWGGYYGTPGGTWSPLKMSKSS